MASNRGYTLIEVLVAMAIFTSMVTLATMALNQGLKQYHGVMEKGVNFWSNAKYIWINKSLGSATDYYVIRGNNGWTPYFIGKRDLVSYVSLSPLAGDAPVVVWLAGERLSNGKQALAYYELPAYAKNNKELENDYVLKNHLKGRSIKLLEDVEDLSFDFYGYDLNNRKSRWAPAFDGAVNKTIPSLVRVFYSRDGKSNTMLFSINTNSLAKIRYDELYREK